MWIDWLMTLGQMPGRGSAPFAGALLLGCLAAGRASVGWVRFGGLALAGAFVFTLWYTEAYPNMWVGVCGGAALLGWLFGDMIRQNS